MAISIFNPADAETLASYLLGIEAVKLSPENPFTWASGWKSPIYCDNRLTLSYPEIRSFITDKFAEVIRKHYADATVVAGVATGAIAIGALVAQQLNLPFVYVRASSKSHGLGNQIEGKITEGQKVVIVEDLISTGGSSLSAVNALRHAGCEILGMVSIFTYNFDVAQANFGQAACNLISLCNYEILLQIALNANYIKTNQLFLLRKWRQSPDSWLPK